MLDSPVKFLAAPEPSADAETPHACGARARAARWFSLMTHHLHVGQAFEALNEQSCELYEEDSSFTPADYRAVLMEGFRRLEQVVAAEFARLETMAKQLGLTVILPGPQGLQKLWDLGLMPEKRTGGSVLKPAWTCLRPENPGGVLQTYEAKHLELIRLEALVLAGGE